MAKHFISFIAILCSVTISAIAQSIEAPEFYVTSDLYSNDLLIIWQKEDTDQIDHYTIYEEIDMADNFVAIGTVSHSSPSIFRISPENYSNYYFLKLTATDKQGNETDLSSSPVKSNIWLTQMWGLEANSINLMWNVINYETDFNLYRNEGDNDVLIEESIPYSSYSATTTPQTTGFYVSYDLPHPIDVQSPLYEPFTSVTSYFAKRSDVENTSFSVEVTGKTITYTSEGNTYDVYVVDSEGNVVHTFTGDNPTQSFTVSKGGEYKVFNRCKYAPLVEHIVTVDQTAVQTISETAVTVFAKQNEIIVKNIKKSASILVYNTIGQLQHSVIEHSNADAKIHVRKAGLYFVVIDGQTYKVEVK